MNSKQNYSEYPLQVENNSFCGDKGDIMRKSFVSYEKIGIELLQPLLKIGGSDIKKKCHERRIQQVNIFA